MTFRGKKVLVWSLNNYIGLANHPEIRKVDAEAAAQWGMAYPMGARMMSGQTKYHEQLESELASFMQKEDAFLLNYGYQGCMSAIEAPTIHATALKANSPSSPRGNASTCAAAAPIGITMNGLLGCSATRSSM